MNIIRMLEAQKELDKANMKKGGLAEYPLDMVQTAYRVELGELLQEWKQFKYWKLNKGEIDRDKMLEEWADCMHFALSLENYWGFELEKDIEYKIKVKECISDIYRICKECFKANVWVLKYTIALGLKLDYTLEELEQAYWKKNRINWERIEGGY